MARSSSTPGTESAATHLLRARELGELLPRWYQDPQDPPVPCDYGKLKAAAIALARASERERRNVIAAYTWAYCDLNGRDHPRSSGIYLLLRVLFVLPEGERAGPLFVFPEGERAGPVHADASGRVIRIDAPPAKPPYSSLPYSALWEYDQFTARFRRRTVTELEALEIR